MTCSLVYEFHKRFGLPDGSEDILSVNSRAAEFRTKFMQEELDEFVEAYNAKNRVKAFDALLDLTYVVYGTALFMGISPEQWEAGFHAVHEANMGKVRAPSSEHSKRNSDFDVIKPAGWVGPEGELEWVLDKMLRNSVR